VGTRKRTGGEVSQKTTAARRTRRGERGGNVPNKEKGRGRSLSKDKSRGGGGGEPIKRLGTKGPPPENPQSMFKKDVRRVRGQEKREVARIKEEKRKVGGRIFKRFRRRRHNSKMTSFYKKTVQKSRTIKGGRTVGA